MAVLLNLDTTPVQLRTKLFQTGDPTGRGISSYITMARRLKAMGSSKYQNDGDPRTSGPGFGVTMHSESVLEPILKWPRNSRMAFLDSMSDVFHARVSADFLGRVFATMALTPQHTYQILTKRPNRMRELLTNGRVHAAMRTALMDLSLTGPGLSAWTTSLLFDRVDTCPWPLPNVWLGTSIEFDEYCWRADELRAAPAAVRFLSLEPLLGPSEPEPRRYRLGHC